MGKLCRDFFNNLHCVNASAAHMRASTSGTSIGGAPEETFDSKYSMCNIETLKVSNAHEYISVSGPSSRRDNEYDSKSSTTTDSSSSTITTDMGEDENGKLTCIYWKEIITHIYPYV